MSLRDSWIVASGPSNSALPFWALRHHCTGTSPFIKVLARPARTPFSPPVSASKRPKYCPFGHRPKSLYTGKTSQPASEEPQKRFGRPHRAPDGPGESACSDVAAMLLRLSAPRFPFWALQPAPALSEGHAHPQEKPAQNCSLRCSRMAHSSRFQLRIRPSCNLPPRGDFLYTGKTPPASPRISRLVRGVCARALLGPLPPKTALPPCVLGILWPTIW